MQGPKCVKANPEVRKIMALFKRAPAREASNWRGFVRLCCGRHVLLDQLRHVPYSAGLKIFDDEPRSKKAKDRSSSPIDPSFALKIRALRRRQSKEHGN